MKFLPTELPGVVVVEPQVFRDPRGFFLETYHLDKYEAAGIPVRFVQDNHSGSVVGTLRGFHSQCKFAQGKLVRAIQGEVFDVAVDIRRGSPHFGRHVAATLSAENHRMLYIPPGFAHGFCVVSEFAEVEYKCTEVYRPDDEITIAWNDPEIGVAWPAAEPILSDRDRAARPLREFEDRLPIYEGDA